MVDTSIGSVPNVALLEYEEHCNGSRTPEVENERAQDRSREGRDNSGGGQPEIDVPELKSITLFVYVGW